MLRFLPNWIKGCLATLLIIINTVVSFPFIFFLSLLKLVVPIKSLQPLLTAIPITFASLWVTLNGLFMRLLHKIDWHVEGAENLKKNDWYFVTCNHQTWADIPILQTLLNGKVPFIKFFLKQELIWVPFLGLAWWALDFPFMKRFSKEYLAKHPELKGKDLETTRKACEKFKFTPITVFNFLEGTRYTSAKHKKQNSPYKYLLKPKAGGAAFVLGAMGEKMNTMLDVTIYYPDAKPSFWGFISGDIKKICIHVNRVDIPHQYLGRDYMEDAEFRESFQEWIGQLWKLKDERLSAMARQCDHEKQSLKSQSA